MLAIYMARVGRGIQEQENRKRNNNKIAIPFIYLPVLFGVLSATASPAVISSPLYLVPGSSICS